MKQYYSRTDVTYTGDRVFSIPFSYIEQDNISIYINDKITNNWIWLNESQVRINDELTANQDVVSIRRTTDIDEKAVDYQNMSMVLDGDNLNLSQNQILNAVQELYDNNDIYKDSIDAQFDTVLEAANTVDTLKEDIVKTNTAVDTAVATVNEATKTLNETNNTLADMKTRLNTMQSSVTSLGTDLNSFKTTTTTNFTNTNNKIDNHITKAYTTMKNWIGGKAPKMTPLMNWEYMKSRARNNDVRNINNTTYGVLAYGGDYAIPNKGDIWLSQSFKNFDKILIHFSNDGGDYSNIEVWDTWELHWMLNRNKTWTDLFKYNQALYWNVWSYKNGSNSDGTYFKCRSQNCGIIEIYGLTYESEES